MSRLLKKSAKVTLGTIFFSTAFPLSFQAAQASAPGPEAVTANAVTQSAGNHSPRHYTVRKGDTLSSIAARYLGASRRGLGLWAANKGVVGRNPNAIRPGERLKLVNAGLTRGEWRHVHQVNAPKVITVPQQHHSVWRDPVGSFTHSTRHAVAQAAAPSANVGGVWGCIAQHESGGNPATNTGNGFYGMYQFTISSWRAAGGGPGLPSDYSAAEQLRVAEHLQAMSGWGNWPQTSVMCGVG
jgi:hypothetical protein